MTTDWRIYDLLKPTDWQPGDEPEVKRRVEIYYKGNKYVLPLPEEAVAVAEV